MSAMRAAVAALELAVAGQLAGARYGLSAIPQLWLDALIHKTEIERIGRTLFHAGETLGVSDVV
jgi:ADP-ribosylglycohydrolase